MLSHAQAVVRRKAYSPVENRYVVYIGIRTVPAKSQGIVHDGRSGKCAPRDNIARWAAYPLLVDDSMDDKRYTVERLLNSFRITNRSSAATGQAGQLHPRAREPWYSSP